MTDALQIPWTSTTEGARTWTLGNRDSPNIKCKDQSGTTTHTWDNQGSRDSALFAIDQPEEDQQQGHIPLRFTSPPDYEAAQDHGTDNEYLIRLVSRHDIHGFDGESQTMGCDGSALDLKIRIKDVGPPAPPTGADPKPPAQQTKPPGHKVGHPPRQPVHRERNTGRLPRPEFQHHHPLSSTMNPRSSSSWAIS